MSHYLQLLICKTHQNSLSYLLKSQSSLSSSPLLSPSSLHPPPSQLPLLLNISRKPPFLWNHLASMIPDLMASVGFLVLSHLKGRPPVSKTVAYRGAGGLLSWRKHSVQRKQNLGSLFSNLLLRWWDYRLCFFLAWGPLCIRIRTIKSDAVLPWEGYLTLLNVPSILCFKRERWRREDNSVTALL